MAPCCPSAYARLPVRLDPPQYTYTVIRHFWHRLSVSVAILMKSFPSKCQQLYSRLAVKQQFIFDVTFYKIRWFSDEAMFLTIALVSTFTEAYTDSMITSHFNTNISQPNPIQI